MYWNIVLGDEVRIKYPLAIQTECSSICGMAILCEFKGCIKYALLQIQIRGENPNTQIAESVSPSYQHIYEMHCFTLVVVFCISFHCITLHLITFYHMCIAIHCDRNVRGGEGGHGGFQYVNHSSSRLLSRLRSTTTSGLFVEALNWLISIWSWVTIFFLWWNPTYTLF